MLARGLIYVFYSLSTKLRQCCKGRKYVIKNILKIRFISFIFEIFAISFICSFDIPISIQVLFHWFLRRYVCFHVSHYDAFLFLCRIPWSGVSLFTINQYLWSIAACVNGTSLSLLSTQYTLGLPAKMSLWTSLLLFSSLHVRSRVATYDARYLPSCNSGSSFWRGLTH